MRTKILVGALLIGLSVQLSVEAGAFNKIRDLASTKYPEPVKEAVEGGYMGVDSNGNFNPKKQVNREQLAKILADYRDELEEDIEKNNTEHNDLDTLISQKVQQALDTATLTEADIEVVDRGMSSTVVIYNGNTKGSGVFIADNLILTANHVIGKKDSETHITLRDGKQKYKVSTVTYDEWNDLAVLKLEDEINKETSPYTTLNISKDTVKEGQTAYAFGHPQTLKYSVTKGIISNDNQSVVFSTKIQFDGQVHAGYSGGALLNRKGEIIGIISSMLQSNEKQEVYYGISFATPLKAIHDIVDDVTNPSQR